MSDDSSIGDIDPDDAFDAEGGIDPLQLARRIFELRRARDWEVADFDLLDDDFRLILIADAEHIIVWLRGEGALR